MTQRDIHAMTKKTMRKLWDQGLRHLKRQGYLRALDEELCKDLVQEGIKILWEKSVPPNVLRKPSSYYQKILSNLAAQSLTERRGVEQKLLAGVEELKASYVDRDHSKLRQQMTLMKQVFSIMRQDGMEDCVELLYDTFTRPSNDRELSEEYGWTLGFVRQKRKRCIEYFWKRARMEPLYRELHNSSNP